MTTNPYAPPTAEVADPVGAQVSPPLWNPWAATLWSLLFSPAFGAFLHMKNWQALGDPAKAQVQKNWVIGVIAGLVVLTILAVMVPESKLMDAISRFGSIVLLVTWYQTSAKEQRSLVAARYGKTYPRRGWGMPLGLAVLAFVGFIVAMAIVGFVLGMAGLVE